MKILIIPDIHHRIHIVDTILNTEKGYDKVIFLGDYFDRFHDSPDEAAEVARWLKPKLWDKNFVCLYGNHDVSYLYGQICGGWSYSKNQVIHSILKAQDFKRMKFFWMAQGWLFTHAGLHPDYLPTLWKDKDITMPNIKKFLNVESERCERQLEIGGEHWFYRVGSSRGGISPIGGILWCDVREEFEPVPRIPQIFGHTVQKPYPTFVAGELKRMNSIEVLQGSISPKDGWSVDLDCHLAYYGVLEDGNLTIKRTPPARI